jgi:hypothetical protein
MSINGIRSPYGVVPPTVRDVRPESARPEPAAPHRVPTPAARTAPTPAPSIPAQAPAGTDPELWSVLTQDERAHFAALGAMGPLTYGRVLNSGVMPQATAPRGIRLDVKA